MKKFLTIIGITLAGLLTGCVTASNPSGQVAVAGVHVDPAATGNAIRIAAKLGAMAEIRHDPKTREYFQLSAAGIGAIIAAGNYNPTNVQASLDGLTGNSTVSMSIADALSLYQDFFGKLVAEKLDAQSPYTIPVLTGLALGLQDAVNLTAPASNNGNVVTPNTIPEPTNKQL